MSVFLFLGMLLHPEGSQAQEAQSRTDSAQTSRDLLRKQMELQLQEIEALEAAAGDEDLGAQILVQRKPKPWTLTLTSDIGEIWSSNVFQVENGTQSDFALTHNDSAVASYRLTDELTVSASYRFTLYRYNRLIVQNFDAHNAGLSFNYALPYDMNLSTGVQWTTIYSKPIGDSVYEEGDWNIGVSKVVPLNFASWMKDRAAWFVGYQTDWRLASPKDLDKIEVSPYTGLYFLIHPQVVSQTFYRWQYQHYQTGSRKDYNNMINSSVTWNPYHWLSVSAFGGYTDNNSLGKNARNYNLINAGASVRFSWKF